MTFSIIEEENKFLTNYVDLSTNRPGLYPSEASVEYDKDGFHFVEGKCLRAVFYRVKGYPSDRGRSVSLSMKAIAGKVLEEATIDRWKKMGLWVGNNIKFFCPELVTSGEMDCVIRQHPTTNYLICYEIKSYEGHYPSREILGSKKPPKPGQPKAGHFLQLSTYAWEYKDKISEFRLYYIDRGGGPRAEFKVGTEEKNGKHICFRENIPGPYWNYTTENRIYYPFSIEDIHKRSKKIIKYLKTDTLPPKDYGYHSPEMIEYLYSTGEMAKKDYEPWKKNPERNKILAWQCIAEGTYIYTENSWQKIETVKQGTKVLTKDGFTIIDKIEKTGENRKVKRVKPYILDDYKATEDHKILVSHIDNYRGDRLEKLKKNLEFKKISDIDQTKINYVCTKINKLEEPINLKDHELLVLGNFITEGSYRKNSDKKTYKCDFTYNINEEETASKVGKAALLLGATSYKIKYIEDNRLKKSRHYLVLNVYGVEFIRFLKKYIINEYSYNKYFTNAIVSMEKEKQKELLDIMVKQDGAMLKMRSSLCWNYTTTSKTLALQVQEMMFRLNRIASIVRQRSEGKVCFEKYSQRNSYHIRWFPEATRSNGIIDNDILYASLNKIEDAGNTDVWDLSSNGNFVTQGGIVHNCSYCDFSSRCKQDSINETT